MPRPDNLYRTSTRIRVKKKWRPFSKRRTPGQVVEDCWRGLRIWLRCMFDPECYVYREEFPAALWGEMGEYGVRFSTFFGIVSAILGVVILINLPGAVFLIKTKFVIGIAMIVIGLRQFGYLNGPIWWADRYAVEQVRNYYNGDKVEHYERYGETMTRLRPSRNLPLTLSEVRRLSELYHQFCTGTLSERSWREIGEYTAAEMDFFYTAIHLGPREPRFPADALRQSDAT